MKKLTVKNNVIRPAAIGGVVAVLGIVLLVYYRYFAKEKSAASYLVSAITLVVGVALAVSALFRLAEIKKEEKTSLLGESVTAKFISYGTDKSVGKVAVYYVEYCYAKDGKTYVVKSPSRFTWYEVLTLKAAEEFPVKVYKDSRMLDCDLLKMQMEHREKVAELNRKYEVALEELMREKEKKQK